MVLSEAFSKFAVMLATTVLTLWNLLSRVWARLAPLRIRFNFLWLKVENLLLPLWRLIEPVWVRLGDLGKRLERSLQVSRKGSAITFGSIFIGLLLVLAVLTPMHGLFPLPVFFTGLISLLIFILLVVSMAAWGYVWINEFTKAQHWIRVVSGVLTILIPFALVPPMSPFTALGLLLIGVYGFIVSSITGGCLDPDAFDYSIYMGVDRQEPLTYRHTIRDQEARYRQSKATLDRVVKKVRGSDVEWSGGIPEAGVEFEPGEEVEFEAGAEAGVEFEPEEIEFESGEAGGAEETTDFSLEEIDGSEMHTVKDYEAGEQKKEMPKEEFEI